MEKVFDGKKEAKLGTEENPVHVVVKTKKRLKELEKIFKKNGWAYTFEVDRKQDKDISDLETLQNWPETVVTEEKVGRNEPCPCGSGKKYKKCCGT